MANSIYRDLLSVGCPNVADIETLERRINDWHNNASLQTPTPTQDSASQWWVTLACDRQLLCDRSLRLMIHRSVLLQWLKIQPRANVVARSEELTTSRCRLRAVAYARDSIKLISSLIYKGQYSQVTLSFILYCIPQLFISLDPITNFFHHSYLGMPFSTLS